MQYPLITEKQIDFVLFKSIVELMIKKEHRTMEGFAQIVNIKGSLNKGLSQKLKEAFPNYSPVPKPCLQSREIIDPN